MNAIKEARKRIARDPFTPAAKVFADLVLSLESGTPYQLDRLYELGLEDFELALQVLKEWRLDRYYAGKAKLYDFALQLRQLNAQDPPAASAA